MPRKRKRVPSRLKDKRLWRTFRFCETGKPWFSSDPLEIPFYGLSNLKCVLLKTHKDDSMTVTSDPIFLSNGNGPNFPVSFFRLNPNGQVSYRKTRDLHEHGRNECVDLAKWKEQTEPGSWNSNVPTWECVEYQQLAFSASRLVLLANRFDRNSLFGSLPLDIGRKIARDVAQSTHCILWDKIVS